MCHGCSEPSVACKLMQHTLLPCFCKSLTLAEPKSCGGERSPFADHKGRSEHHALPQSHDVLQFVRSMLIVWSAYRDF